MQRYDIINWLIEKYGYETYLEIGVAEGECFEQIRCDLRVGVDPNVKAKDLWVNPITSDFFFSCEDGMLYDIIFIDGDHHEAQVLRDINNSLKHLSPGGTIVLHDCNPPTKAHTIEPGVKRPAGHYVWNGTVWKAFVKMNLLRTDLVCRCVDTDWGCGIIQRGDAPKPANLPVHDIVYEDFDLDRELYLNLITVEEFKEIYAG